MNVTFACPKCDQAARQEVLPNDAALVCLACKQRIEISADAFQDGELSRCLVCPSTDLFVRKDFPQRLGVGIVAAGIIGSSIAWSQSYVIWTFAILFATALIDVVLYALVPDALMCYRCSAEYRSAPGHERHGAFNLETHERHRQLSARLAGSGRSSTSAV